MTTMRTYRIRNSAGDVIAEHVRVDLPSGKKDVKWKVPGHSTYEGLMGLSVSDLPLYGTHLLGRLEPGRTVIVCEGEKATEALWSAGVAALGTVTGASGTPGEDALAVLLPFDVVLWPDYDEPGEKHMARVAATLIRLGGRARRLAWGREKGDDAADFLDENTLDHLDLLVRAAAPCRLETPRERARRAVGYERDHDDSRVQTARSHLLQVVEEKLGPPVRRMGRSLFWPCPFHAGDREPSFKVDLREPFYRCFGCEAKGDVFTFLRASEGRDFKDVIRELAPPRLLGAAIPW
jgi:DNA primase